MISITAFLLLSTGCMGFEFWNDFRATWGAVPTMNYFRLPRNIIDAQADGWLQKSTDCENDGDFNGFRWTHPNDSGLALLFDANGYAGGVQALVPQEDLFVSGQYFQFDQIPMYQNHTIDGITYFVVTAYFAVPENMCIESPTHEGNIGTSSKVWFQNGKGIGNLKEAYKHRSDAISNGWTVNNCIPGMGWHNFYEVETWQEVNCEAYQPTCILYDEKDEMHGFCLTFPGNSPKSKYFEHPSTAGIAATLGETAPQCLLDSVELIGTTTMHIYFTNNPWVIGC